MTETTKLELTKLELKKGFDEILWSESGRTYANLEGLKETAWFEPIFEFENETLEVLGDRA